jgi:RNA polymerase sigma-70 factor (ECF subfamily)
MQTKWVRIYIGFMARTSGDVTHFLSEAAKGNPDARAALLDIVYRELHCLASSQMRAERFDHTLQPTALVHEAYLRLFNERQRSWASRGHFFAFAARVMRNILIDYARRHASGRDGGNSLRLALEEVNTTDLPPSAELLSLDRALDRLSEFDPRQGQIVELRFFAGLTEEEIAEVLHIGLRTVKRDWIAAKAWLYKELESKS